jgi:uncharacterized membrane protein
VGRVAASVEKWLRCHLSLVFALYGSIAVTILALIVPPFQHAEEGHHFMRAYQIAHLAITGTRFETATPHGPVATAGGLIDPALVRAAVPFAALVFHPEIRAKAAMWSPRQPWTGGSVLKDFPNTVVYAPLFYLPSALAIRLGEAARLSVTQTLLLSRLFTGYAGIGLATLAIALAGANAICLFAILTLPMSFDLMASVSQDALLLACTALAAALLVRAHQRPLPGALPLAAVLMAAIAMAKPPYLPFAALLACFPGTSKRARALAIAVPILCAAAWLGLTAATDLTNFGAAVGAEPHAQIAYVLSHPMALPYAITLSLRLEWLTLWQQFIGVLGWLDTPMPDSYYWLASVCLALAVTAAVPPSSMGAAARWLAFAAALVASMLIFASLYLAWTSPGGPAVLGVEGRYFLPVAVIAILALPTLPYNLPEARVLAFTAVALLPILTLGIMIRTIQLRYYLT